MNREEVIKIDVGEVIRSRLPGLYRFIPRCVVKLLEKLICQEELNRLLEDNAGKEGAVFCHGVLESLDVKVDDQNLKNYVKGFEMIYTQLKSVLEKEGVCEIEALDKPFDPNFHNALMQEKREGVESGIVIEVLQKGYMLKDRVLRATLVKVSE